LVPARKAAPPRLLHPLPRFAYDRLLYHWLNSHRNLFTAGRHRRSA
jgi:hypothetical protein